MSDTPLIDRLIELGAFDGCELISGIREVSASEAQLQALVAEQVLLAVENRTCEWQQQLPQVGGFLSACGRHLCSMQSGALCQYCGRKIIKVDAQQEQKGGDGE